MGIQRGERGNLPLDYAYLLLNLLIIFCLSMNGYNVFHMFILIQTTQKWPKKYKNTATFHSFLEQMPPQFLPAVVIRPGSLLTKQCWGWCNWLLISTLVSPHVNKLKLVHPTKIPTDTRGLKHSSPLNRGWSSMKMMTTIQKYVFCYGLTLKSRVWEKKTGKPMHVVTKAINRPVSIKMDFRHNGENQPQICHWPISGLPDVALVWRWEH